MNKYNAERAEAFGRTFDSKGEARRYGELRIMQIAKLISHLSPQPKVYLEKGKRRVDDVVYRPDFLYHDNEANEWVHEDFKGVETERFRLIKKLWKLHGPTVLLVTKAKGAGYEIRPDNLAESGT